MTGTHDALPLPAAVPRAWPAALERLYAATTAMSAVLDDEPRLLRVVVVQLAALLDARYAALGLLGDDGALVSFETTGLTADEELLLRPQPPHGRGIIGALLREGQPLRLEDLTKDHRSVGFPPGHPPMHTFLGVPLLVGGHVFGRLYVTEKRSGFFTAEDELLALGFAGAAAVAVQSARQTARLVQAEHLRAAGELALGISHDFNNLLATILGRTEVLLGQVRDPEQLDSLAAIRRAARDGGGPVARMREYGRPVDVADFQPVDLAAVVGEAVQLARPRWQNEAQRQGRTIDVRLEVPWPHPHPVLGDDAALREVLVNLLFNAVDALPGGGTIVVGVQDVADNRVELLVSDTGVGMPDSVQRHIFEPFFTTKGAQGSGLGLPMVRKVVDAHGGSIGLESAPGRGTTFRVRLPAIAGAVPGSGVQEQPTAADVPPAPATIVLVDDQEAVLQTMGMLLRRDGHHVRAFHDPRAAVEACLAERPDVVLTDLGMPGLSGWDVARLVHERWPDLPVVLLTGWGRDVTAAQLRKHGVATSLSKPAELPDLRKALTRVLAAAAAAEPVPLRILLVDDAAAFAAVLSILLGQGGHAVRRVAGAGEAIAILNTDQPIDLVLLDLHLPDLPSLEVLRAARARPHAPLVCVVRGSAPQTMQHEVPGADLYAEKAHLPQRLEEIYAATRHAREPRP